jgi:hypothetical protein
MKKGGYIYALKHPITKSIFYVGKTSLDLKTRLNNHYWGYETAITPKARILQNLAAEGLRAAIEPIEFIPNDGSPGFRFDLERKEKHWIAELSKTHTICNMQVAKSAPQSFRVNLVQLERIKKATGLTTMNQVVDFLFDAFDKQLIKLGINELSPLLTLDQIKQRGARRETDRKIVKQMSKANKYPKVEELPQGAKPVSMFADEKGYKVPYIYIKYERSKQGKAKVNYNIINFQGINFIVEN